MSETKTHTVWGRSADDRWALIGIGDQCYTVRVSSDGTVGTMGARWECSRNHMLAYADVYADRFPIGSASR